MISPIEEIIEEARQGRMVILADDEGRENEGDLMIPAQFVTPQAINFMITHGRGLVCLAMAPEIAKRMGITPMAVKNDSRFSTPFGMSIEAKEGVTTGVSAFERATTIGVAIDPTKGPQDLVSPGHVFPLIAQGQGVLARQGHTEAAVDIAALAGLTQAGVICEVLREDGHMARMPDLLLFARTHGLKIGTVASLVAYRQKLAA